MASEGSTVGADRDLARRVAELERQLTEALEQHTATAEVLRIISTVPGDLQPVFDAILANATRICDARFGTLQLYDGTVFHAHALFNVPPPFAEALRREPRRAAPTTGLGRLVATKRPVHIEDCAAEVAYAARDRMRVQTVELGGVRTSLVVPLLKGDTLLGGLQICRQEVRPFTDKQIELVTNFAAQAVIAVENVRLFEEVKARNTELRVALEQQTATSELLKVIGRSTLDLQPVFETLAENAVRLCEAERALIFRFDGQLLRVVATHNVSPELKAFVERSPIAPGRQSVAARAALERRSAHFHDVQADPELTYFGNVVEPVWTALSVPMLRAQELLGVIMIYRHEVRPFTDSQVALIETFADQAVIAIENARLFEEVQTRTRELTRSVAELKALGEIGRVISSTLDLGAVLNAILMHACRLADSGGGAIYVFDSARGQFELEAGYNMPEDLIAAVRAHPIRLGDTVVGQCAQRREAVQIEDLTKGPPHPLFEMHIKAGIRALLAVPLLHQDKVVGALVVRRKRVGAFAPETVSLLQSFAAQSAVAIENARLFHEIADKSRQLEIASQHKSQFVANMSHELRTPLAAILGYVELMQEGFHGALSDKAKATLARVQSNGRHLLGLINSVLDIAKIEAGQFNLNLAEYALDGMVETVRVQTESLATAKKLALKAFVATNLPRGFGDEPRLTQVLLNLVGNAIKFTDRGEVRITAGVTDAHFALDVSDTGPGIPPAERDRIFEEFHQIDNTSTRTKGGTGLGLAIAKQIVEMHGGRIWVESTVGKGSTFRIELPVRAETAKRAA